MRISKCRFGVLSDGTKVRLYTTDNGTMSFRLLITAALSQTFRFPTKKEQERYCLGVFDI